MALLGLAPKSMHVLEFVLVEYPTCRRDREFEYSVALGRDTRSHESTDIAFQVTRELGKWMVLSLEVLAAEETQKARVARISRRTCLCPGDAAGAGRTQCQHSRTDSWRVAEWRVKEPF